MKNILITGKNSYIGNAVRHRLEENPTEYTVTTIDLKDPSWQQHDFSAYDVVFHVAGIVHIRESKENQHLYYSVNRDLAYETAKKAKKAGVEQFIFLSTMSVYGLEQGIINSNTKEQPKSAYGKSKLEAEELIRSISDDNFIVSIIRPPMVYGPNCKGNYPRLAKLATTVPIFPRVDNVRSMIFIDNLSEFIKVIIDKKKDGLFFPQNREYVNTSEMVEMIAKVNNRSIRLIRFLNPIINSLKKGIAKKVFGTLVYEPGLSNFEDDYNVVELKDSITKTETK